MTDSPPDAVGVMPLEPQQVDVAGDILARAFRVDPLQTYLFPNDAENVARSPAMFATLVRYGLLAGEVLTTAHVPAGIAVWLAPDHVEHEATLVEAGFEALPHIMGSVAHQRFVDVFAAMEPYHRRNVSPRHWYLMILGVDPEAQGRGIGTALMEPVLARADAAGVPCYLETCQAKNVAFYQRRGFQLLDDEAEPASGLRFWTFRRDPHSMGRLAQLGV